VSQRAHKRVNAKKDLPAQLPALNQEAAAPGVPKNYPDPTKLVTEDCIKQ
jgi:hypothetical protein